MLLLMNFPLIIFKQTDCEPHQWPSALSLYHWMGSNSCGPQVPTSHGHSSEILWRQFFGHISSEFNTQPHLIDLLYFFKRLRAPAGKIAFLKRGLRISGVWGTSTEGSQENCKSGSKPHRRKRKKKRRRRRSSLRRRRRRREDVKRAIMTDHACRARTWT